MATQPDCPTCSAADAQEQSTHLCPEGHAFAVVALPAAAEVVAAMWRAVQALDDEADGLAYLADSGHDAAQSRGERAAAARVAADVLRREARAAQQRLDTAPEVLHAASRQLAGGAGAPAAAQPRPPSHLAVLGGAGGAVSVRCGLCGETCPVAAGETSASAVAALLRLHPWSGPHPGGCPQWGDGT